VSPPTVIVAFHEVLDTGEARIPLARAWVRVIGRPFFGLASAFVIHPEADRRPIEERYRLRDRLCVVIPQGPNDHHAPRGADGGATAVRLRDAPRGTLNLLFFGIIRPYKGLEDLVRAFEMLDDDEVTRYWLTIVGETWEGWDLPIRLIEKSRHRRITLVNRFVSDDEVTAYFAGADAVVLPYHRASASSPASAAMANGLPLVVTEVGGLPDGDQSSGAVPLAIGPSSLSANRCCDTKGSHTCSAKRPTEVSGEPFLGCQPGLEAGRARRTGAGRGPRCGTAPANGPRPSPAKPIVMVTARWRARRFVRSTGQLHILGSSTSPGPGWSADKDPANEFCPTVTPRSQARGVRARRHNAA
jgi:hypothetical protein